MAFWTYTTPALQGLWVGFPYILSDWDSDGCQDISEDPDDDNDGYPDWDDSCTRSPNTPGYDWTANFDNDVDGCEDSTEDTDLDNDGVESDHDRCEDDPSLDMGIHPRQRLR